MIKSDLQERYEQLIVERICLSDLLPYEKANCFLDFLNSSEMYYDDLCTYVYRQATNTADGLNLWVELNGRPYLSEKGNSLNDLLFLKHKDCPVFENDIKDQLCTAFMSLS